MDVIAHMLWAGAGVALLRRRRAVAPGAVAAALALAAAPDLVQLLPLLGWWLLGSGSFDAVRAFAFALPGQEPALPPWVAMLAHHLHCIAHSAVVAVAVTVALWWLRGGLWLPLLGWWSHIVIDVFTHSADFYASPVLYPFTQRGFDGVAWNQPWFQLLNYLALAVTGLLLLRSSRRRRDGSREAAGTDLPA